MNLRPSSRFPALSSRIRLVLEFLLYAVLTALMLHATWLTWPDAYIDFSRELYLPWRVSCGDVLYRDLAYDFGPLSVYTNAALFAIAGRPSIHALLALNFVFWAATLLALRTLLRRIASPLAATIAVSAFILLFSFSRYTGVGNYNFLAPYSHEITRGFLFALLALLALDSALTPAPSPRGLPATGRVGETPPSPSPLPLPLPAPSPRGLPAAGRVGETLPDRPLPLLLLSGFLLGLSLFSKPELALASTASLALLFVLHARRRRSLLLRPFLVFSLAVFATIVLVATPFAIAFHSFFQAIHDTLFKMYLDCFNPALSSLPFYQEILGTDRVLSNVLRLLLGTFLAALPFLLARGLLVRLHSRSGRILAVAGPSALAAAIGWWAFFPLNAALPLAPLVLLAVSVWPRGRHVGKSPSSRSLAPPLASAFSILASFLSLKMFLNAGIGHYGFLLLLPAFCCAVVLAFPPDTPPLRTLPAAALFVAFAVFALRLNATATAGQQSPIHDAAFLAAPPEAHAFNTALGWVRANTPPGSTLAVLPEGAVLNVLADRPNPTPFVYLSQGDWLRFGSAAVLAAYSNAPPDTLVLVRKSQDAPFGTGYAQELMALLDPLYTPALAIPVRLSTGEPVPYLLVARRN